MDEIFKQAGVSKMKVALINSLTLLEENNKPNIANAKNVGCQDILSKEYFNSILYQKPYVY